MCAKVGYRTEHEAAVALVEATIKRNNGNGRRREIAYYFHRACRRWHLTSMPQPRRSDDGERASHAS